MKLRGINITSLGTLRNHFDLEEIWGNIENGMLLNCERVLMEQNAYVAKNIAEVLEVYEQREGLGEIVSGFYCQGKWNFEELVKRMEPLLLKSKDHKGNNFCSRNEKDIRNMICTDKVIWKEETVVLFYLFLLLMLQGKPQEKISEKEFLFIEEYLGSEGIKWEEKSKQDEGFRLYPYEAGILYLKEGRIVNGNGECFSSKDEKIACYAYTDELGLLAFTEQGTIAACTEPDIRYEIDCGLMAGASGKVIMVAAYGGIYILLMEDRTVLSNVKDVTQEWKDIRWVGAGLNTLTAIRGKNRYLLSVGSDHKLDEYSNVRSVCTWSTDEDNRYIILKEDGSAVMDDGRNMEHADAVNIDCEGYVYAVGAEVFLRQYDSEVKSKYKLPEGCRVAEICKYHSIIYCRVILDGKEEFITIDLNNLIYQHTEEM